MGTASTVGTRRTPEQIEADAAKRARQRETARRKAQRERQRLAATEAAVEAGVLTPEQQAGRDGQWHARTVVIALRERDRLLARLRDNAPPAHGIPDDPPLTMVPLRIAHIEEQMRIRGWNGQG